MWIHEQSVSRLLEISKLSRMTERKLFFLGCHRVQQHHDLVRDGERQQEDGQAGERLEQQQARNAQEQLVLPLLGP